MEKILRLSWPVPFGEFALKLDFLSLLFLAAIAILVICCGIYGVGYMRPYQGKRSWGVHVFFFLMLALALGFIVTANNVILFLAAWEAMSLATYFLIVFYDEKASVRKAGLLYLIAAHCGTFLLFLMFFLMARTAGSLNFDVISRASFSPLLAGTIFLLAMAGFGVKAGFIPLHIWLPHAHPAAPSHVSALLSGVAIKTGIYGICRVLWMVGVLPLWCGYALLVVGVVSGVMGVLYALGQHELKKLLAYHSVENIGIIALGLGAGLLGRGYHQPFLAVLGFGGALLHVLNHSLFKGLLFLGAGAVIQKTHTGEMDQLGGLAKVMPVTSALFLVGSLSICGLPLFNGFISEFIIYFALFQGLFTLPLPGVVFCALGIVALALMGALALACFTKVYGTVFCGEPRAELSASGRPFIHGEASVPTTTAGRGRVDREQTSLWMTAPMMVLAGWCVFIGLAPGTVVQLTFLGGACVAHAGHSEINLESVLTPLFLINGVVFVFLALMLGLVVMRRLLLGPLPMPSGETWRCGFAQFSTRFQYTSSSYARSIVEFMKGVLLFHRHGGQVTGYFPGEAHVSSSVHDASEEGVFRPLFLWLIDLSRRIDNSRIRYTQMYLMYIFLFLIFLLVWKLK